MRKEPLVSVIIPTRNSERTLEKCLKSVRNQSYKKVELIVVDNNSSDKTKSIARKYADKVYNKGPERSAQRNFGVRMSKGEYVLIHDSDIYFHKDSVKECVNLALKGAKAIILPEKSIGVGYWARVKAFERSFYVNNDLIEAPRFFEKELFLSVGGYDESLTACEDWDLTNRIRAMGVKIYRTKHFLLHDEGRMDLFGSSKKKAYYSKWIKEYKKRYPELAKKQFSVIHRFTLKRLIKEGVKHPLLMVSMVIMKLMEWCESR